MADDLEFPADEHAGMTYLPETLPAIERLGLAFDEMDLPPQGGGDA